MWDRPIYRLHHFLLRTIGCISGQWQVQRIFNLAEAAEMQVHLVTRCPDSCYSLSNLEYRQLPGSDEGIAFATLVLQGHNIVTQLRDCGEAKIHAIPVVKKAHFRLHINSEGLIVQSKAFHFESNYA